MPKNIGTEIIISKISRSSITNFSPSLRSFNRATSVTQSITPYQVFLICSENLINQRGVA